MFEIQLCFKKTQVPTIISSWRIFRTEASQRTIQALSSAQSTRKSKPIIIQGGFAKCYEVSEEKTGERYACKAIDKESISHSKLKEKLQSEIEIHRRLIHKNIVRFESVF